MGLTVLVSGAACLHERTTLSQLSVRNESGHRHPGDGGSSVWENGPSRRDPTEAGCPQRAESSPRLLPVLLKVPPLFEERGLILIHVPLKLSTAKKPWPRARATCSSRAGLGWGLGQHWDLPRSNTLEKGKARLGKKRNGLGRPCAPSQEALHALLAPWCWGPLGARPVAQPCGYPAASVPHGASVD